MPIVERRTPYIILLFYMQYTHEWAQGVITAKKIKKMKNNTEKTTPPF